MGMTPLERLVAQLHEDGLSQLAKWLEVFLQFASNTQLIALQRSLFSWVVRESKL